MGNGTPSIRFQTGDANTYQLSCTISTACGNVYATDWVTVSDCEALSAYNIYPNPVSSQLTVAYLPQESINKLDSTKAMKKVFSIELLDAKGNSLRKQKNESNANSIVIDTQNLQNDTYILHIADGKKVFRKQVIIRH